MQNRGATTKEKSCGSLNETAPYMLRYLNTWSLADSMIWRRWCRLAGGSMPWRWALSLHSFTSLLLCSLRFTLMAKYVISHIFPPATCCHVFQT